MHVTCVVKEQPDGREMAVVHCKVTVSLVDCTQVVWVTAGLLAPVSPPSPLPKAMNPAVQRTMTANVEAVAR